MKVEFSDDDLAEAILGHATFTMNDGTGAFCTEFGRTMANIAAQEIVRDLLARKRKYVFEDETLEAR